MDPLEPELRERLKKAFPNLLERDLVHFEGIMEKSCEHSCATEPETALRMRAEEESFILEKMPGAKEIMLAFEKETNPIRPPKKRKVRIRKKPASAAKRGR